MAAKAKPSRRKRRALYVTFDFPQASQTYIHSEISALADDADVHVIAIRRAPAPAPTDVPVTVTEDYAEAASVAREFKPDVLHGHWLYVAPALAQLSRRLDVPFTIRAHSFDTLITGPQRDPLKDRLRRLRAAVRLREYNRPDMAASLAGLIRRDACLGVLTFPFVRNRFIEGGAPEGKIHDVFPVVDVPRFDDRGPNGDGVMNVGACIRKKSIPDFIDLAAMTPDRPFRLYPIGYDTNRMRQYNEEKGAPVEFRPMTPYADMPGEYKRHAWLVYTGAKPERGNAIGWPMAVAEAQASGCGVCLPNIRPDLRDYVGDSGVLYDDVRELPEILRDAPSNATREAGFRQAKKSDIHEHKSVLLQLWDGVA